MEDRMFPPSNSLLSAAPDSKKEDGRRDDVEDRDKLRQKAKATGNLWGSMVNGPPKQAPLPSQPPQRGGPGQRGGYFDHDRAPLAPQDVQGQQYPPPHRQHREPSYHKPPSARRGHGHQVPRGPGRVYNELDHPGKQPQMTHEQVKAECSFLLKMEEDGIMDCEYDELLSFVRRALTLDREIGRQLKNRCELHQQMHAIYAAEEHETRTAVNLLERIVDGTEGRKGGPMANDRQRQVIHNLRTGIIKYDMHLRSQQFNKENAEQKPAGFPLPPSFHHPMEVKIPVGETPRGPPSHPYALPPPPSFNPSLPPPTGALPPSSAAFFHPPPPSLLGAHGHPPPTVPPPTDRSVPPSGIPPNGLPNTHLPPPGVVPPHVDSSVPPPSLAPGADGGGSISIPAVQSRSAHSIPSASSSSSVSITSGPPPPSLPNTSLPPPSRYGDAPPPSRDHHGSTPSFLGPPPSRPYPMDAGGPPPGYGSRSQQGPPPGYGRLSPERRPSPRGGDSFGQQESRGNGSPPLATTVTESAAPDFDPTQPPPVVVGFGIPSNLSQPPPSFIGAPAGPRAPVDKSLPWNGPVGMNSPSHPSTPIPLRRGPSGPITPFVNGPPPGHHMNRRPYPGMDQVGKTLTMSLGIEHSNGPPNGNGSSDYGSRKRPYPERNAGGW